MQQTQTPRDHSDVVVSDYMEKMGWNLDQLSQNQNVSGSKIYNRLRQRYFTALMLTNTTEMEMYKLPMNPYKAFPYLYRLRDIIIRQGLYNVGKVRCTP